MIIVEIGLVGFHKRKAKTSKRGSITVNENDPLSPEEVLAMYCMGIDEVVKGGKKK